MTCYRTGARRAAALALVALTTAIAPAAPAAPPEGILYSARQQGMTGIVRDHRNFVFFFATITWDNTVAAGAGGLAQGARSGIGWACVQISTWTGGEDEACGPVRMTVDDRLDLGTVKGTLRSFVHRKTTVTLSAKVVGAGLYHPGAGYAYPQSRWEMVSEAGGGLSREGTAWATAVSSKVGRFSRKGAGRMAVGAGIRLTARA